MACRTAGGNDTPEKLWQFLLDKKDGSGEVPSHRWEPWYRRDTRNAKEIDKTLNKGYFIHDLENFDASFFGISPKEAEQMDPHQRLALELSWEALEHAGINPKDLAKSDTAVYMGIDSDDYSRLLMEDIPNIEPWMGIGTAAHGVANRVSYHLDLMGPSAAVDAACASSLVAVDSGRLAIQLRESEVALVGGVNVLLAPALTRMLDKAGALSQEGICRSFDDAANGYARGEGGAVLVLKNLRSAQRDGDRILAVLKGSAVAQDGKTNGIMAPNTDAQELVGRRALQRAGVDPLTIGYVEAHATATPLGDPTEISAIAKLYGHGVKRPKEAPCQVGSIKPNIGHLEAAAGAIGMIKAVMAVYKGQLAPQTYLDKLNSRVDWAECGLEVVRDAKPWKQRSLRRAAVCSYGYGGTVSHAIIEEWGNVPVDSQLLPAEGELVPMIITAPLEKRLSQQVKELADWLATPDGQASSLHLVANTLAQRRAMHDHRLTVLVRNHDNATDLLGRIVSNSLKKEDLVLSGRALPASTAQATSPVWVFSGHGAQWLDMGRKLHGTDFQDAISEIEPVIQEELGFSIREALATGDFESSERAQIATYAVQYGLSRMLMAKGLRPSAVVGHSIGEMAASVQLMQKFRDQEVETFRVKTDIAFHSPMLDQLQDPLRNALDSALDPQEPTIPLYSTSLDNARGRQPRGVDYWVNNMVKPVQLRSAIQAAADDGHRMFLEVSSHPIVLHSVRETLLEVGLKEKDFVTTCTMRRNTMPEETITIAISNLFVHGAHVDFGTFIGEKGHWCTGVPRSPWFHKPYYRQVETGAIEQASMHDAETHHLLGRRTAVGGTDISLFGTKLSIETKPFPGTHPLDGTEIIPAGVYINTFHHATGGRELSDIQLRVPVSMTNDIRSIQVAVQGDKVSIASTNEDTGSKPSRDEFWIHHAACQWGRIQDNTQAAALPIDIPAIRERIVTKLPNSFAVDFLSKIGVAGIAFPWQVVEHYGNETEMIVHVDMLPGQDTLPWDSFSWAPLLDAATSVGSSIFFNKPSLRIISSIEKVLLHSREPLPKMAYLHVEEASNDKALAANVHILDEIGHLIAQIQSMKFSEVEGGAGLSGSVDSLVHQIDWVPARFSETPRPLGHVVLVSRSLQQVKAVRSSMQPMAKSVVHATSVKQLAATPEMLDVLSQKGSTVVYLPGSVDSVEQVAAAADEFVWETASLLQCLATHSLSEVCRMFILTNGVFEGLSPTGLAQGALIGLGRIIAAEHPDTWGGLIDHDIPDASSLLAFMYVRGHDIIRNIDGLPRRAVMRPLSRKKLHASDTAMTLLPKSDGTYVITGGLGSLGLDTADFLVKKGARRILLVSRRPFPVRSSWAKLVADNDEFASAIRRIQSMERAGAAVCTAAIDMSLPDASKDLLRALDNMQLPRVLGVVHCAGVLEDSLVLETSRDSFRRVMAPKVNGALALHEAFPPGSVDFFVLYSSIGQLVGTVGQASYGASNAFLDAMAYHRRAQGDNAVAMQFTAWRGSGMGASTEFLTVELESKGITDISSEEAFRAWEHLGKFDIGSAVVTRCLAIDEGSPVAVPILEDIVVRRPRAQVNGQGQEDKDGLGVSASINARPTDAEGLRQWLEVSIRQCIAAVLMMPDITEIDGGTMVNDLGIDSVMTVALRRQFQDFFQIKVPPTLTWKHPTVDSMVPWFAAKLQEE
ncbi:6-methylsalicylic acid synthase [Emericellopsis atlantica]|uniref:6-methylsalicylic acid synthase n=1 Tax=Emericellopsis atlantica TaxID=2614577 RepID=A0A9P7ZFV9_9HYPO|nr:6-methylsalicylic acid synthase [Emericellopsis atlantica]KAG9250971.1 6-methylsalicylic acid synthase [Emericellopsis atlantica]